MRALKVLVATAAALVVATLVSAAQRPSVGVNGALVGLVQTRTEGEAGWRPSAIRAAVRYADEIQTGPTGRLRIDLWDKSVLSVGTNARLTVDRFAVSDDKGAAATLFSVARGAFRYSSGSRGRSREKVRFKTPTAAIGIRGTIIDGAVGREALDILGAGPAGLPRAAAEAPELASVIILREGEIELTAGGQTVILNRPGQAVLITGGDISRPFDLPRDADQRFQQIMPDGFAGPRERSADNRRDRQEASRDAVDRPAAQPGAQGAGGATPAPAPAPPPKGQR